MDPEKPWDFCLKAAANDRGFWEEELDRKCMLFITHLKTQRQLMDKGHGAELGEKTEAGIEHKAVRDRGGRGGRGDRPPAEKKSKVEFPSTGDKGGAGKGGGKGKAKQPDGRFRVDEKGKEICWRWNHSEDGCAELCQNGRAHVCEWCRSFKHRSIACPKKPAGWAPRQ